MDVKFVKYEVEMTFRDRVLANVPTDFKALPYIAKNQLKDEGKDVTSEEVEERVAEIEENLPEKDEEEPVVQGFFDDQGLFVRERNIKGLLKEAGRMLSIRGYREAINHGVFVKPEKIYYTKPDEEKVEQADFKVESGIRVSGPRGPRSALKVAEALKNPQLQFQVWIIPSVARRRFPDKVFKEMWGYAQEIGLQGDRSLGEGKFDVKIKKISKDLEETEK